jgi:hypothetical protein
VFRRSWAIRDEIDAALVPEVVPVETSWPGEPEPDPIEP